MVVEVVVLRVACSCVGSEVAMDVEVDVSPACVSVVGFCQAQSALWVVCQVRNVHVAVHSVHTAAWVVWNDRTAVGVLAGRNEVAQVCFDRNEDVEVLVDQNEVAVAWFDRNEISACSYHKELCVLPVLSQMVVSEEVYGALRRLY